MTVAFPHHQPTHRADAPRSPKRLSGSFLAAHRNAPFQPRITKQSQRTRIPNQKTVIPELCRRHFDNQTQPNPRRLPVSPKCIQMQPDATDFENSFFALPI